MLQLWKFDGLFVKEMEMNDYMIASLILLILAYVQNVSFSIVSRSRNRSSIKYHLIAAVFSNSIWFLTFRYLVTRDMSFTMFPWYCLGTVLGSVTGVQISMWFEKFLHADSDSHLKPKVDVQSLQMKVTELEKAIEHHRKYGFYPEVIQGVTHEFTKDTISDGFGSVWSAHCAMCGQKSMQVVRPGKVQCSYCG